MHRKHEQYKNRFQILAERLNGLSPSAKLVNGFGYIAKQEEPVKSVEEIQKDDTVTIRVHDGVIETVVTDVKKGRIGKKWQNRQKTKIFPLKNP